MKVRRYFFCVCLRLENKDWTKLIVYMFCNYVQKVAEECANLRWVRCRKKRQIFHLYANKALTNLEKYDNVKNNKW